VFHPGIIEEEKSKLKEIKRNKIQYKKAAATKILFMLVKINKKHSNNLKSFKCF
jgi:hypothetical protein